MSDDSFLLPSSPSTVYSYGLEYEQSQHKQEIRDEQEAQMTPEELEAATAYRRAKRQKLGLESSTNPSYPGQDENWSPARTPRSSAVQSIEKTSRHYLPYGLLDSQATSQDAIDALIAGENPGHRKSILASSDITSQDVLEELDYRRQPVVYTGVWRSPDA
ncbi:hypothetical protein B0H12DRAFT_371068 [Mycena haematopus]|nr:hypothetical protein B0H12DRAFT_371068 [Mycena haematopus]